MSNDYRWERTVSFEQVGPDGLLRLSDLLKWQQEAGERHFIPFGLGCLDLLKANRAFVLLSARSRIVRLPRLGETVFIQTWHRGARGVRFFRCYRLTDEEGSLLIDSVSSFALVQASTHQLLRPQVLGDKCPPGDPTRDSTCSDPEKRPLTGALPPIAVKTVLWSETDVNRHLNNTRYADILCDYLPGGMAGRRVTGFQIDCLKEARAGDQLSLFAKEGDGEVLMEAKNGDKPCFGAVLYCR